MLAYRIVPGSGIAGLASREDRSSPPLHGEVRVRVGAASLNYHDLMLARNSQKSPPDGVIPVSDAAGEVIDVGPGVTRFRAGDRVTASFFPHWVDGAPTPEKASAAFGGALDGLLAEEVTVAERSLIATPPGLSDAEAATLPCAGVTAWNALFVSASLKPGSTVLLLGTGGVSVWALQLAHAAGLRTIVTSSSDAKLDKARGLGANHVINYRSRPEWQTDVLEATGGRGVDLVVEVGGEGTLSRSLSATRMGGTVAVIGGVTGFGGGVAPSALIPGSKKLVGIFVGSRTHLEELGRFVTEAKIRPVIDRVFPFAEARAAYEHLESGGHFGKVVIAVR